MKKKQDPPPDNFPPTPLPALKTSPGHSSYRSGIRQIFNNKKPQHAVVWWWRYITQYPMHICIHLSIENITSQQINTSTLKVGPQKYT